MHPSSGPQACRPSSSALQVVDCTDWQELEEAMKEELFFGGLRGVQGMKRSNSSEPLMLKLRDWPPAGEFNRELPRHNAVQPALLAFGGV